MRNSLGPAAARNLNELSFPQSRRISFDTCDTTTFNPSFTDNANVDVRGTDAFYAVQRRLHNAVAAVRAGQELHLTDGAW